MTGDLHGKSALVVAGDGGQVSAARVEALATEIRRRGGTAEVVATANFEDGLAGSRDLDILVIATDRTGTFAASQWAQALEAHARVISSWRERATPLMAGRHEAVIVNVVTTGPVSEPSGFSPSQVVTATMTSLTRRLAAESASNGIRFNTVVAQGAYREEELTEVMLFLASGRSADVTGQVLVADRALTSAMARPAPGGVRTVNRAAS